MSRIAGLTIALIAAALIGCSEEPDFERGGIMVALVQRTSSDRCVIAITPRWGGPLQTARLEGCKP